MYFQKLFKTKQSIVVQLVISGKKTDRCLSLIPDLLGIKKYVLIARDRIVKKDVIATAIGNHEEIEFGI